MDPLNMEIIFGIGGKRNSSNELFRDISRPHFATKTTKNRRRIPLYFNDKKKHTPLSAPARNFQRRFDACRFDFPDSCRMLTVELGGSGEMTS